MNLITDQIKEIVEAYQGTPELPVFSFSPLEETNLHLENTYPLVVSYFRTATAQISGEQKSYDVVLLCLEKMPERIVGQTDVDYQKIILDKQELFKKFLQHVVYFLQSPNHNYLYTLTGDLIRFIDTQEYLEWDLFGTEAQFNLLANTEGFVCDLPFNFGV